MTLTDEVRAFNRFYAHEIGRTLGASEPHRGSLSCARVSGEPG